MYLTVLLSTRGLHLHFIWRIIIIPRIWHLALAHWHWHWHLFGIWHLASGIWHLAFGIWHWRWHLFAHRCTRVLEYVLSVVLTAGICKLYGEWFGMH